MPLAILLPILILALVVAAIDPLLDAVAVLVVVLPVPFVHGAVGVDVHAEAIGLVVLPFALVDVAVHVGEFALAVGFVVQPVPLVAGAVGPGLHAVAVAGVAFPLPVVDDAGFEGDWRPLLARVLAVVEFLGDGLFGLEVFLVFFGGAGAAGLRGKGYRLWVLESISSTFTGFY